VWERERERERERETGRERDEREKRVRESRRERVLVKKIMLYCLKGSLLDLLLCCLVYDSS